MSYFGEGVNDKFWAKAEASYDTVQAFAAGDAIAPRALKLEATKEFHLSKEKVGTASAQAMIGGQRTAKWSLTTEIATNAAGTAPDIGEVLKAAMGTETVSGGVSVTYAFNSSAPGSLQLGAYGGPGLYEVGNGAWVEQFDLELKQNDEPTFTFSGGYATHGFVYGCTVNTSALSSATTVYYTTAHKGNVTKNVRVKFGSEDNAGAGYLVTAVDDTVSPPALTISPGLANGVSAGAVIAPFVPSQTLAGTILGGVSAGLSIDATTVNFRGAKISVKTGFHGRDKEASQDRPVGVLRGPREVSGEIDFTFEDTATAMYQGRAWSGTTRALILRVGANTSGARMTINIPKAFIEVVPLERAGMEETTFKLKFRALQNSAADDEMTIVFD